MLALQYPKIYAKTYMIFIIKTSGLKKPLAFRPRPIGCMGVNFIFCFLFFMV